jgi:2'-5' RNA ligase
MTNQLRTFIAIEIPPAIQEKLVTIVREAHLTPENGFRPVRSGMIHITLKFLGDIDSTLLPRIGEILAAIAKSYPPFDVQVKGLGAFSSWDRPRTVWAGLAYPKALPALATQIDEQCARFKFARETRPFSPHLTLARVSENANREKTAACLQPLRQNALLDFGNLTVSKITFFRSTLQAGGSIYTPIATYPLSQGKV